MTRTIVILVWLTVAASQTGCGTACGPIRTVPTQRLALMAPSPSDYTIRVKPCVGAPIETPVPSNGRIEFDVPVRRRASTIICFGLPVYHYPPPDTLRAIRVMSGDRTVRKLSAQEVGRLPTDPDGYHVLVIER